MRLLASSWVRAAASVGFASVVGSVATPAVAAEPDADAKPVAPSAAPTPSTDIPPDATRIIVRSPTVIVVEPGDVAVDNGSTMAPPAAGPTVMLAPPAPIKEHEVSHWFGWQTLLVDGVSVAAGMAVGHSTSSGNAGTALFLTGYTLGGPIVHWSHGQIGKGFASLGIRIGAPLVLGITGALVGAVVGGVNNSGDDAFGNGAADGAAVGVLAGYIGAVVIDSAVLSRENVVEPVEGSDEHPQDDAAVRKSDGKMFTWTPSFGMPKGGGATAGISGTF